MSENFQKLMSEVKEPAEKEGTTEDKVEEQDEIETGEATEESEEGEENEEETSEEAEESEEEAVLEEDDKGVPKRQLQAALKQEREERRRERDKAIALEQDNANLKAAVQQLLALEQQKAGEQEKAPEIDPLDPEAHGQLTGEIGGLRSEIDALKGQLLNTSTQSRLATERASFMAVQPDLQAAADHLIAMKKQEAQIYGATEEQAMAQAAQQLIQIGANAIQRGVNSAEAIYKTAQTYGYAPKKAKATGPNIAAIAKNKAKGAGIQDVPGVSAGTQGNNPIASKESFAKHVLDKNGAVDMKKLAQVYSRIDKNAAA